tara:strand:+ start:49 stop:1128 length:1080 start_codon:yes stop_codon:yes gene_type:complete
MPLSKIQTTDNQVIPNLGRRNLIINGAMQIAQRATTSVTNVSSGGTYRTVDRFFNDLGSSGTFTVTRAGDGPDGFGYSFKLDCTTADASPNYHLFVQKIEGQNLQQISKGTSSAKPITLSFYVKSNKAGTYSVNARDRDNDRFCYKSYTINSANTWERKTVTFPADTTGALDNDNANSMDIEWWVAAGSTYNSGSTTGAWGANVNGNRAAANTVNIGTSTDDEWLITGVQLEVGSVASEFEHRSFAEELKLCERYFFTTYNHGATIGASSGASYLGRFLDAAHAYGSIQVPTVYMRASPTRVIYNPSTGTVGQVRSDSGNHAASITATDVKGGGWIYANGQSIGTSVSCKAHLTMDAEL